jgi:hypothetical protein
LRGVVDQIRARGAELVVIGNGSAAQAREFRDEQQLTFPLLTDPSLESYRRAGFRRGVASTLGPRAVLHGLAALGQGFVQGRTKGDPLQQGGALVVAAGGRLLYHQVSREAGDHAAHEALLDALDRGAAPSAR